MSATTTPRSERRSARWLLPNPDLNVAGELARELGLEALPARILAHRGFQGVEQARQFLSPGLGQLYRSYQMADMNSAVDRILRAIRDREPILLYGDYDVDGTVSIVILKTALELMDARVSFHVPHRLKEGYGMRADIVERASLDGVKLIVSVDTGIRANDVVRQAQQRGIDVIVTDHHLPEAELPPAIAVLNPNRKDCPYPEKNLCGAGVTFKLIQALIEQSRFTERHRNRLLDSFLKLVAIATVADIVPLVGENRTIVRRGLSGLQSIRNAGLRALMQVSGLIDGVPPSVHQIAFRVAPRINAAGRMASASDVVELFLTDDPARARVLAQQLDDLNRERQQAEAEMVESIVAQCSETAIADLSPSLVFAEAGWHLGVVGIVASRLVERFCRPVFVLSDAAQEGCLSGSGRSIPAFHLLEALESMPELFVKFGGHRQAAGLTIRRELLPAFRNRLAEFARTRLTAGDLCPQFTVDAGANFTELTDTAVEQIFTLAPFGFGNPAPLLMSSQVEVAGPPRLLGDGKHLKVALKQGNRTLFFNAWNFGEHAAWFEPGQKLDILFTVDDDPGSKARGYMGWCYTLKDIRP